jgi:hypothetical protein
MKNLADLGTARTKRFARGLNVGNNQVQASGGSGCGRRNLRAELD